MQLISFIAFVMTVFSFVYQKMLRVYMLEKVKTIFLFFLVIRQKWLIPGFSGMPPRAVNRKMDTLGK